MPRLPYCKLLWSYDRDLGRRGSGIYGRYIDLNIEANFFRGKGMDFESGLRWGASQQFQEKRIGLRQGRELERESEAYIVPA